MADSIARWFSGALFSGAQNIVNWVLQIWRMVSTVVFRYAETTPYAFSESGWHSVAFGNVFGISMTIGTTLVTVFFVWSWIRESTDLRSNLRPEYIFRLVIRLVFANAMVQAVLALAEAVMEFSVGWTGTVLMNFSAEIETEGIFAGIQEQMDAVSGGEALGISLALFLFSLVLVFVILICSFQILVYVVKRFFKVYVAMPFGAPCLASLAGGERMWQPAIAWLKTFLIYNLEAVIIALAMMLSFTVFGGGAGLTVFSDPGTNVAVSVLVKMMGMALPFLSCSAIISGSEEIVRRFVG